MTLTPFIIVLISTLGYASFRLTPLGKLKLKRYAPSKLVFTLGLEGTLILIKGCFVYLCVAQVLAYFDNDAFFRQTDLLKTSIPYYQISNAVLVLLASTIVGLLIRILYGYALTWAKRDKPAQLIRKLVDDEFELFLLNALELDNVDPQNRDGNGTLARIVLDSRKVYVANIVRCDLTMGINSNIVIVPMHSGYQDEKTLEVKLTEHYEGHFNRLSKKEDNPQSTEQLFKQFEIVLPIHTIVTASLFNIETYIDFLKVKVEKLERSGKHSTSLIYPSNISFDDDAPPP